MTADKLDLPFASDRPPHPAHFFNAQGLGLRMQVFVIVRDGDGRICCVREKHDDAVWKLPGETLLPGQDVNARAAEVSKLWFGKDLGATVKNVITYPDTGDGKWYIVFVYEATVAGVDELDEPEDTEEFRFTESGKAPGPWGMSHGDVFEHLA